MKRIELQLQAPNFSPVPSNSLETRLLSSFWSRCIQCRGIAEQPRCTVTTASRLSPGSLVKPRVCSTTSGMAVGLSGTLMAVGSGSQARSWLAG
jgi:hypothetical protein